MDDRTQHQLDVRDGTVSFLVRLPGISIPRIVKRVVGLREHIMLIGEDGDPTAPTDLLSVKPDLALRLPRPVAHTFLTDKAGEVVIVVGPSDTLDDATAEQLATKPRDVIEMTTSYFVLELRMVHELHVIAGLPGSGRRKEAVKRLRRAEMLAGPGHLTAVKVATTRAPRSVTDYLFFDFLTPERFVAKEAAGELVQVSRIGNVCHGIEIRQLTEALATGDGLCILLEPRVDEIMALGISVTITEMGMPPDVVQPSPDDIDSN
jgi:hypothetical protein